VKAHGDRQLWLKPNPAQGRYVRLPVFLDSVPPCSPTDVRGDAPTAGQA